MTADSTLGTVVDYAVSRQGAALSSAATADVVLRLVDTFACSLGGATSVPAVIARSIAQEASSPRGCSVLGSADKAAPEQAIFANTVATRYLDYNDHYPGSGHPSDMVPALLAAAELEGASGARLLLGLDAAYEVATAIGDRNGFRASGFDQGAHVAAGIASGIAVMLAMPATAIANALAIAITSTMPMRATRAGELSDWKGCATAAVARNAFLATRLAALGLSGPPAPFEGVEALDWHAPPRGPLRLGEPGAGGYGALRRTNCKLYPVEGNAQAILLAMSELREELDLDAVESIAIETYHRSWHEIGGGQGDSAPKWDPKTRETADHSLPYLVAVMLTDGRIDPASFEEARVLDPALRPLMRKITITPADDLTALHPGVLKSRIGVRLRSGRLIACETRPPPGEWSNPLTAGQVEDKYRAMAALTGNPATATPLREAIAALPNAPNVHALTAGLRAVALA